MSIAHRSVKTPEQIHKEVIGDLVDSALIDARFLRQLVAVYVDKYSEEQIRKMWRDAGLDELTKWYALDQNGDMIYVGEFGTFEAADESLNTNVVWLVDEETARTWLTQLKEMLE